MKPTSRGFTLIEVLVAIVVLTIGIMALAGSCAGGTAGPGTPPPTIQ